MQLSKKTGISASHLGYIERNEKEPTISVIIRIAMALNVKIEELYKVIPWCFYYCFIFVNKITSFIKIAP